jgi:transcriptional regulator with XRE-family HTH domain
MLHQKESTGDLMKQILESKDIEKYIEKKKDTLCNQCISDYFTILLQQKQLSRARVIEKAGIDRVYGYEIFRGKKIPGRDTLLRILLVFRIDVDDIQHILKNTGYPILYPKNIRDAIIIYGIQKSIDFDGLNTLLYDLGQKTI